jgi:hypothetical protein
MYAVAYFIRYRVQEVVVEVVVNADADPAGNFPSQPSGT